MPATLFKDVRAGDEYQESADACASLQDVGADGYVVHHLSFLRRDRVDDARRDSANDCVSVHHADANGYAFL